MITRDMPITFGKPGGPLNGKCLAQLDDSSIQWLTENAKETDWMRAALAEQQLRASGQATGLATPAPAPPPAAAPAPAAADPYTQPGAGPGHHSNEQPPAGGNGRGRAPLPRGPAGMPGKHFLDSLVLATHYAFGKLIVMGWPRSATTANVAEKLGVSTMISCSDRGIDLLAELEAAKQVPPKLAPAEDDDLPFWC